MTPSREQDPAAPEVAPERARDARWRARPPGRANRKAGCPSRPGHREAARPRPYLGSGGQPRPAGCRRHRPSTYAVRGTRCSHRLHRLAAGASGTGFPGYARNHPPMRCALRVRLRERPRVLRVQAQQRSACSPNPTRRRPNRVSPPAWSQGAHALAPKAAGFVAGSTGEPAGGVRGHAAGAWRLSWR